MNLEEAGKAVDREVQKLIDFVETKVRPSTRREMAPVDLVGVIEVLWVLITEIIVVVGNPSILAPNSRLGPELSKS